MTLYLTCSRVERDTAVTNAAAAPLSFKVTNELTDHPKVFHFQASSEEELRVSMPVYHYNVTTVPHYSLLFITYVSLCYSRLSGELLAQTVTVSC
jgi:hypothetical protein